MLFLRLIKDEKIFMKKLMIGIVLTISVFVLSLYLFLPGKQQINEFVNVKAAMSGVTRLLSNDSNWYKWWPGDTAFTFNRKTYFIKAYHLNAFDIAITKPDASLESRITLVFLDDDSTSVRWHASLENTFDLFKRISHYRKVKEIGKDLNAILTSLKKFAERPENIYGIRVIKTKVADSVLISTRRSFTREPGVHDINRMIQDLRNYIMKNGAKEKNSPMLNIKQVDSSYYEVMTAIAVDRELPTTNQFAAKFMLKGGNILEAEIKGGPYTIENAFNVLEIYRADHNYTSPAIPFQMLVTDRARETDTTKWITKLYYPIL